MATRRNTPCPCGSGKKYKHCHGRSEATQPAPGESRWRRLRAALDGFPATMLRFARQVYGRGVLDEAWAEFTLWEDDEPEFDPDSHHLQVFMPWFFHRWAPDPAETYVEDPSLPGRSPTSVLLERKGRWLDPELKAYLEACLAEPFSFHEVLRVEPGRGFRARDLFTGRERDVVEHSASRTMRPGDVFFGQLVTSADLTLMEACSVHAIPPGQKLELIDLREWMTGEGPPLSAETLADWDIELRGEYLELMEALRNPPMPRLENTEGEPMAFHRLHFRVPSAQGAFDALKHLALDETEDELLESAELDAEGRVRRASFSWKTGRNPVHPGLDNMVLGHLEIDGERLMADVNSAGRAARLMAIVESCCPDARHTGTDVQTVEDAMAERRARGEVPEDADASSPTADTELQDRIREIMARHYEDWIHEEIPALGDLSPMDAVRDRSGREKVEALIAQIERDGRRHHPPLDEAVTRRTRERLGLTG